jgi:hypothetical protein
VIKDITITLASAHGCRLLALVSKMYNIYWTKAFRMSTSVHFDGERVIYIIHVDSSPALLDEIIGFLQSNVRCVDSVSWKRG